MKPILTLLTTLIVCQPLLAGSPADREEEMRRAREKESGRAKEMAMMHSNQEEFANRYGHLKEDFTDLYAKAAEKRRQAAAAWQNAAKGISSCSGSYDQISALKLPAYTAEAEAELARLELKAAATEREWKRTVEKAGSRDVEAAAQELIRNQREMIQKTREQMSVQRALRQLEIDRNKLEQKMRESYEKSKERREPAPGDRDKRPLREGEHKPPLRHDGRPPQGCPPNVPNPPNQPNQPRVD